VNAGKELTESWSELLERIQAGDVGGIHVGDYKPVTLTTGEVINMVVDSIRPGINCDDQEVGRHIAFLFMGDRDKETWRESAEGQMFRALCGTYRHDPTPILGRLACIGY